MYIYYGGLDICLRENIDTYIVATGHTINNYIVRNIDIYVSSETYVL